MNFFGNSVKYYKQFVQSLKRAIKRKKKKEMKLGFKQI